MLEWLHAGVVACWSGCMLEWLHAGVVATEYYTNVRGTFSSRHVVLSVIHVETELLALSNAELAFDTGADGVFLINHSIGVETLLEIHSAVSQHFPSAWIGVNCLGLPPAEVYKRISPHVSGVWADNAMIDEASDQQPRAQGVLDTRKNANSDALYFGGVAFKYQRHVDDLVSAALKASQYMDVVTTSGPGTGQSANIEKIKAMKQALGEFPLAIASGITPGNIHNYLPYADCFLVATGVSKSFTQLDESLLGQLIETVRVYDG